MVARVQVSLSPEEHRRAKQRAAELGISFAEYVRRLVAEDLGEGRAPGDVRRLVNLGDSGGSDIARHKDAYVADAIEAAR
jgi:hypothetical protein